ALERLGWLRFVEPSRLEVVRAEIQRSGYPLIEETGRVFHADAEELAEGHALSFVAMLAERLRYAGVELELELGHVRRPPGREGEPGWLPPVTTLRMKPAPGDALSEVIEELDAEHAL